MIILVKDNQINVQGSLDLTDGWEHISKNKGKTVEVAENETQSNKTTVYPDECDVENMTDLQKQVVFTSVMNKNLCSNSIGKIIGKQGGYVRNTLKRCCPNWYEDEFKPATEESLDENPLLGTVAAVCEECGEQAIVHKDKQGKGSIRCGCQTIPIPTQVPDEWSNKNAMR